MPKKKYTVTGSTKFKGVAPGGTLEAELTEAQEARAIARGSIAEGSSDSTLEKKSREELDELAVAAGLDPEEYDNKPAVIKALRDNE